MIKTFDRAPIAGAAEFHGMEINEMEDGSFQLQYDHDKELIAFFLSVARRSTTDFADDLLDTMLPVAGVGQGGIVGFSARMSEPTD